MARLVIQKLNEHLKTTGYQVRFIFGNCGEDRTYRDEVVKAIKECFGEKALHGTYDCPGMKGLHNGLNQAMNQCLTEAFTLSDVCLRLEDDWVLQNELDLGPWCDLLKEDENTVGVRLGQIKIEPSRIKPYREDLGLDWIDYAPNARYPINHQVFLVHKRLYALVGEYREDMSIDEAEFGFGRRFRVKCKCFQGPYPKVLWPHGQPTDLDEHSNRHFVHGGISSPALKHDHFSLTIPEWLIPYQEPEDLKRLEEYKKTRKISK